MPNSAGCAVAAGRHDTTWLQNLGITFFQYQFRNPDAPYYYENLANEAGGMWHTCLRLFSACKSSSSVMQLRDAATLQHGMLHLQWQAQLGRGFAVFETNQWLMQLCLQPISSSSWTTGTAFRRCASPRHTCT